MDKVADEWVVLGCNIEEDIVMSGRDKRVALVASML